jgi:cysteinyl-tRNA synthetase
MPPSSQRHSPSTIHGYPVAVCFSINLLLASVSRADALRDLATVKSWGYQLQNVLIDSLADSLVDLLVIDYSLDGTADKEISPQEIGKIQGKGKIVLAYLSIGEAEDYRFYFRRGWLQEHRQSTCGVKKLFLPRAG